MGVRAIDVSRWQGSVDWRAVKGDGVRGAWLKVGGADGSGGSFYRDAKFETYRRDCDAVGMPYGTYWFFVPRRGQAVAQARYAVSVGHGTGALWPMVDVESNPNGLSISDVDAEVTAFCAETMALIGRETIVYTYSGAMVVGYSANAPGHCALWIANYGTNGPGGYPPAGRNPGVPPAWSRWDIWQFNSVTRVPGVPDNSVDQNVVTDEFWARMAAPQEEGVLGMTTEADWERLGRIVAHNTPVPELHIMWATGTQPDGTPSEWARTNIGTNEDGTIRGAAFSALSTDQFLRVLSPSDVDFLHRLRDYLAKLNPDAPPGIIDNGAVPDDLLSLRTIVPRDHLLDLDNRAIVAAVVQAVTESVAREGGAAGIDAAALDQLVERVAQRAAAVFAARLEE